MKYIYLYLSVFIVCFFLHSCKSSKHITKTNEISVCAEDFQHLNNNEYKSFNALVLKEIVDVSSVELPGLPWSSGDSKDFGAFNSVWETKIADKILFLKDNINSESIPVIDYFNPQNVRWDLMKKCQMWLYSQDKKGNICKRRVKKKEIIHERLNNSTCRVLLNIQENMAGKILVRKYNLISPYYAEAPYNRIHNRDIKSWVFQKNVPLLYGQFKICTAPGAGKVVKVGDGQIDIKREGIKESSTYFMPGYGPSISNSNMYFAKRVAHTAERDADLITVTVSDIMPLPKDSKVKPLEVQVVFGDSRR